MTTLVTALYAEGRTDERFLPVLLQRSMTDWLARYANRVVDVLEPFVVNSSVKGSRAERILAVAQQADAASLCKVIGTSLSPDALSIPLRADEIERLANPKQRLRDIVRQPSSSPSCGGTRRIV